MDAFDQGAWDASGSGRADEDMGSDEGSDMDKTEESEEHSEHQSDGRQTDGGTSTTSGRKRRSHTIDKDLQLDIAGAVATEVRAAVGKIDKAIWQAVSKNMERHATRLKAL